MPKEVKSVPTLTVPDVIKRRLAGALVGALLGLAVKYGFLSEASVSSELVQDLSDALVTFLSFAGYAISHKWLERRAVKRG